MNPQAQLAYQRALGRIEECRRKGHKGTHLDLRSIGLTHVPPEIGELVFLNSLQLFDNQLSELPAEVEKLAALQHLDLNRNHLPSFPLLIFALRSLKQLFFPSRSRGGGNTGAPTGACLSFGL